MMEISVRLAAKEDIPELVRLRLAYFDEEFGVLPQAQLAAISAQLPQYFAAHLGADCIAVAAALPDGHLAACALLTVTENPANPSFPNGRSGYVLGVFTEPEYRGRGLATHIMRQVLEEAMRLRLDTVRLSASDMGKGIYARLGFAVKESHFTEMEWFPA